MFHKDSKDPVTLGIYTNKPIEKSQLESKIGGFPVWLTQKPDDSRFICKYCHEPLYFVSQIYAPDEFDRVLYVFGCIKNECSQHSDSWVCIRQQKDTITEEVNTPEIFETKSAFQLVSLNSYDWNISSSKKTDVSNSNISTMSITNDSKTNLSASSNTIKQSNSNSDDLLSLLNQFETKISSSGMNLNNSGKNNSKTQSMQKKKNTKTNKTISSLKNQDSFSLSSPSVLLEEINSSSLENSQSHVDSSISTTSINSQNNVSLDMNKNIEIKSDIDIKHSFPCYHIDFIEEKKEKINTKQYNDVVIDSNAASDEKYDDDSKSKLIVKFYSQISKHPKQILRYAYGGLPLLPCQPKSKIIPPKCKCGGNRIFECQLLPSIISLFHIEDDIDISSINDKTKNILDSKYMDFSSLFIYCCENSCKDCDEEYIYVLPPL